MGTGYCVMQPIWDTKDWERAIWVHHQITMKPCRSAQLFSKNSFAMENKTGVPKLFGGFWMVFHDFFVQGCRYLIWFGIDFIPKSLFACLIDLQGLVSHALLGIKYH